MRRTLAVIAGLAGVLLGISHAVAAQTTPARIPWATGSLTWDWTKGVSPLSGDAVEFRMKCGVTSGQYTLPVVSVKPMAPATVPLKSVPIRTLQPVIDGQPRYCVVTAVSADGGESGPSNEYFFLAVGEVPAAPTNLRGMP